MITEEATLHIDDEFASLIPPLTPEELAQLEDNILADGCRDPLVAWAEEGILLDGHNRYRICQEHNISFDVRDVNIADREAAKLWIEENQLGRRNLTDDQRAALAYRIQQKRSERARRERARTAAHARHGTQPQPCLQANVAGKQESVGKPGTRAAVAREAKVSERRVRTVAEVAKVAPEMVDDIAAGKVTLKQATKAVRKQEKQKRKAVLPVDLPLVTDRYVVHQGELAKVGSDIADQSVDWIITDPPYGQEHLSLCAELSEFASRILKSGGSLLCLVGQSYLPAVIEQLGKRLTYWWTLAYLTPGGQSVQLWDRRINAFWKPLLWFVKGRYERDWVGDVCRSDANDKRHHRWGQSESGMADIVERFTYPGETICDPFCGGGTTGVVAVRMNRLFIGIDSDGEAVATTLRRLTEVVGT